ncbi:MAG: patatin-like phospholipase family protein [Cytophagaceae bacterium]
MIEGEELWLKFFELYAPVRDIKDFNDFSIPFACIGTDVVNGKPVLLNHGEITKAIRSSMAIPSVFSAVNVDSFLLVDGGVVRNFPVQDVRSMGADYVIGIDISTPNLKQEEMKTVFDIMMQIAFYTDALDLEKEKSLCDVYIKPDLKEFTTADFDKGGDIVDLGIEEGLKWYPFFKKLADSLQHYQDKENRLPVGKDSFQIDEIELVGVKKTSDIFFLGKVGLVPGEKYTIEEINEGVRRVFGTRSYKKVVYSFQTSPDGKQILKFEIEENPLTYVKAGIHFDTYTGIGVQKD